MAGRCTPPRIGNHDFYHVLKTRISKPFCANVYPQPLYDVLCSYGIRLNVDQEEMLKARERQEGRSMANDFLLDCLVKIPDWFSKLLMALRDERIGFKYLAEEFEKEKAYLINSQNQPTSEECQTASEDYDEPYDIVSSRLLPQTQGKRMGDARNGQHWHSPSVPSHSSKTCDVCDSIYKQAHEIPRDQSYRVPRTSRGAASSPARAHGSRGGFSQKQEVKLGYERNRDINNVAYRVHSSTRGAGNASSPARAHGSRGGFSQKQEVKLGYERNRDNNNVAYRVHRSTRGAGHASSHARAHGSRGGDSDNEEYLEPIHDETIQPKTEEVHANNETDFTYEVVDLSQSDTYDTVSCLSLQSTDINYGVKSNQQARSFGYTTVKHPEVEEDKGGYTSLTKTAIYYDDAVTPLQKTESQDNVVNQREGDEIVSPEQEQEHTPFGAWDYDQVSPIQFNYSNNIVFKRRPPDRSEQPVETEKYVYDGRMDTGRDKKEKTKVLSTVPSAPKEKPSPSIKETKKTTTFVERQGEFNPERDFSRESVDKELASMPGYHTGISEDGVELAMKNQRDGTYLIWYFEGSRTPAITVIHCRQLKTFLIRKRNSHSGMKYFLYKDQKEAFTMKELVDHHLGNGIRYEQRHIVQLQIPVTRTF